VVGEIRIYAEGGGNGPDTRARFRQGLSAFLGEIAQVARQRRVRWHITVCGGRQQAYDRFASALEQHSHALNVLLVDAEGPVSDGPWAHLRNREHWDPSGSSDDQAHLMVQMMEAWLVADRAALVTFYGPGFNEGALPGWTDVELIPKADLKAALKRATSKSRRGPYAKIRHGAPLLEAVDPSIVRKTARHCDRLFTILLAKLGAGP